MVRVILIIVMMLGSYVGFSQTSEKKEPFAVTANNIKKVNWTFNQPKFEVSATNLTFEIKLF